MPIKLYASEILRLTVEDIGDEIFVNPIDQENVIEEHVLHLRDLVQQRAEKTKSRPANAGELADKLRGLSSEQPSPSARSRSHSVTSSFRTGCGTPEPLPPPFDRTEEEAYNELMADGGRPSHPVSLGSGPDVRENPPAEYKDIFWFWNMESGPWMMFCGQLKRWMDFRKYQITTREWYITRDRFHDYQKTIRESQEDLQCTWDLTIYEDPHKQNPLQDWIEFRAFYHQKVQGQRKRTEPARKRFLHFQKELDDIEPGLGGPIPDPEEDHMTKTLDGIKRIRAAQNRVKTAEQQLLQARSSNPICVTEKNTWIEEAEQKLALTQKMLDLEYDLGLAYGKYGIQLRALKKWMVYLKWIDDQYPALAAQCGYRVNGMVDDGPILGTNGFTSRTSRRSPHQRRRAPIQSVLGPHPSSKISKPSNRSDRRRRKDSGEQWPTMTLHNPVDCPIPLRRSERLRRSRASQSPQGPEMCGLGPIHSSRVAKTKATMHTAKQPILAKRQSTRTRRPTTDRGKR